MKLSIMRRFYFCIEACKVLIELSVQNANVDAQAVHLWFKLMRNANYSLLWDHTCHITKHFQYSGIIYCFDYTVFELEQ